MDNNIIAAIILGSSRITGLVGSKDNDGTLRIKAHVSQSSSDFIVKGRVLNVEKTASCLTNIKATLEENASCRIKAFYVAINCQGLRSIINEVSSHLPTTELVSTDLLNSIMVRNKENLPNDRAILAALPLEYKSGAQIIPDPEGMQTDHLQAKFLNVICNNTTISTIVTCFRKANIEIAGGKLLLVSELLASVLTTEKERTSGCAIVDLGSDTTTVSVYKGKLLRHLVVIPLGSSNITRDIENVFNVEQDEAEHLKRTYGYPDYETLDDKEEVRLRDGGRSRKVTELASIIDGRMEEIVQNVKHQIELSGYTHETLVNGLFICGGGAQMKNVLSAFQHHFKDEWNVRIVKNASRLRIAYNDANFNANGNFNAALAALLEGTVNCYGGEFKGIFDNEETGPTEEELKAQEEEAKRKEEETARKKAEEEQRLKEEEERLAAEEAKKKKGPGALARFTRWLGDTAKSIVNED